MALPTSSAAAASPIPPTNTATPPSTSTPAPTDSASTTPTQTSEAALSNSAGADAVTGTPTPTPCFGSIVGQVVFDRNGNRQFDTDEPGVMGAVLSLKNSGSIVGLYNTGSGQFSFPGVVSGTYNLEETPPEGYKGEDALKVDLTVACGATVTQNFMNVPGSASDSSTTPSPTTMSANAPSGQFNANPVSSSGFAPFTTGPAYYLGGCGSITSPGIYFLTTSIVSQQDCIQIFTDNVIVDCQGFRLDGVDGNGYGVVVHHTSLFFGRSVRNIEIRNCAMTKHKYGIFVDAADNLSIHDNNASGNFDDVDGRRFGIFLGLVEGGGIRVNDTRGAYIGSNHTNGEAIGLDIRMSTRITVRGNSADGNSAWGIHFYGVTNSEISSNASTNNVRYCTWGSGVVGAGCDAGGIMMQSGSSNNVVLNNTIAGSNGNGIFIKAHGEACGDGNTIANNHIDGTMYNGIELSFCQNNHVQGNEISNSKDGIWMGFAVKNEIDAGNFIHDMSNHGIISWNSQDNNLSSNRIVNSRDGLYFYSSDYDKQEFWFVPGSPSDHVSRGNCLCANTLASNWNAAIHLSGSVKNQVTNNTLIDNKRNFLLEGDTSGNIIQDNVIQGGAYLPIPRAQLAAARLAAGELALYSADGAPLPGDAMLRALYAASPFESFDLRWFKYKLRTSLGIEPAPAAIAPASGALPLWTLLPPW